MTREEKEQTGKYVLQMARLLEDGCYQQEMLLKAVHIIDEALEQESTTKNDLGVNCIDRAQAQAEIEMNASRYTIARERDGMGQVEWSDQLIKVSDAVDIIRHLPPVTPQEPRWIPVSEKLPEPFTFVNATCRSLVDDRENWVVETLYLPIPKEVNKHGYSDWGNIPMLNWGDAEVIAWVERIIPQPYKAEIEPQESEDKG